MTNHIRSRTPTECNATHFPFAWPAMRPAPIVLSVYVGKTAKPSRSQPVSVIQAWRLAREQYTLLEQVRERLEFNELQSLLDEFIDAFDLAAVLVGGARWNAALVARIASQYPNLVRRVQADGGAEEAQLRALAAIIVNKRVAIPAEAPWRDLCVRRFCAISQGKLNAQVRAAMQFVDHAHEFAALAAPIEKPGIAAAMIGSRSVAIGDVWGEPGVCANGREAIMRRLTGPILHITTKVIY
jgi:pimeloyl-ACP methyl ester carboxylesterase